MMTSQEQEQLIIALMTTAEIMGSEIKPNVALMMIDDLSMYRYADVAQALTRVRRECSGKLTLKMILDILSPDGGWLSANEAWAIALPAIDESATVIWTCEMAKAFQAARQILEGGDKIGARMAFIPAYERFVDQAKRENRQPTYEVSAGWDAHNRDLSIANAVTMGLLPPPKNDPALLPPPMETAQQKQLREDEERANRARLQEQLQKLAIALKENDEKARREVFERQQAARKIHEDRKAELIKQLGEEHEKSL